MEMLNITITSMPRASSTSSGRPPCSCCLFLLPHLGFVANATFSSMFSLRPWMVSKAGQMINVKPSPCIFECAVWSGPSEGRGQKQPNNQHPSDCDNVRHGPLKLRWVQWTTLLQWDCLVGCWREWMGTSGLQKCLNAMEGMVEDSSRD